MIIWELRDVGPAQTFQHVPTRQELHRILSRGSPHIIIKDLDYCPNTPFDFDPVSGPITIMPEIYHDPFSEFRKKLAIISGSNILHIYGHYHIQFNIHCRGHVNIYANRLTGCTIALDKSAVCKLLGTGRFMVEDELIFLSENSQHFIYNASRGSRPFYIIARGSGFVAHIPIYQTRKFAPAIFVNKSWGIDCRTLVRNFARMYLWRYTPAFRLVYRWRD